MRHRFALLGAATLAACGQPASDEGNTASANTTAEAEKPRPRYCFFKDAETKGWAASRDASGNVVVKGRAYRSDPRYQAVLGEPQVTGATATISPSIVPNATGYAAPENWWDVTATIPGSASVETVTVACGKKVVAELKVAKAG